MTKSLSEKCRLLVVNDDQKVSDLLQDLLEPQGYEVASAADGGSALTSSR